MEASISDLQNNLKSSLTITSPTNHSKEYSNELKEANKKLWAHCLIATPLADTGVSKELLAKALTSCFQLHKSLKVITIKNHDSVVILRFSNDRDLKLVFNNGPWSIFGQLLLLLPFNKDRDIPEMMVFKNFSIWFGMKNLPLTSRSASYLLELVEDIMEVGMIRPRFIQELDDPEEFRIQGLFDRDDFLPAGRTIKNDVGVDQFVSFVYEKLRPAFYNICRKMGHDFVICPLRRAVSKPFRAEHINNSELYSETSSAMDLEAPTKTDFGLPEEEDDHPTLLGNDQAEKKSSHPHPNILSGMISGINQSIVTTSLPPVVSKHGSGPSINAKFLIGPAQTLSAQGHILPDDANVEISLGQKSIVRPISSGKTPVELPCSSARPCSNATAPVSGNESPSPSSRSVTLNIPSKSSAIFPPAVTKIITPSSTPLTPTPVQLQSQVLLLPKPPSKRKLPCTISPKLTTHQLIASEARKVRQSKRKLQLPPKLSRASKKSKKTQLGETSNIQEVNNSHALSFVNETEEITTNPTGIISELQTESGNQWVNQNTNTVNWDSINREAMEVFMLAEGGSPMFMDTMLTSRGLAQTGSNMDIQGTSLIATTTLVGTNIPMWAVPIDNSTQAYSPGIISRVSNARTGRTLAERVQIQDAVETRVVLRPEE